MESSLCYFDHLQIGVLEDTRNRTLHGILRVQSCFRGYQARCSLEELRGGFTALQSCISFFTASFCHPFIFSKYNRMEPYLFMQLLGGTKSEKHMQLCFRDIELLLLYKSRWKQFMQETEWGLLVMLQLSFNQVKFIFSNSSCLNLRIIAYKGWTFFF